MYKNQLQELAQRSCFSLPSYSRIREGPDHAPRFKATVNFNGETFESPAFCSTLRQAEHAAAEVALNTLAMRGPSRALAARVLDETGVYKNLLQETAHRAGLNLPTYTTVRSGPRHVPIYSSTVELAGMSFIGQPARTKKQAQKNAAMAAWSALRKMTQECASSSRSTSPSSESKSCEEQEQVIVARFLSNLQPSEKAKPNPHIDQLRSKGHGPHARSLYPVQCQSLAYSGFPPEMFIYHMWEQETMLQQQHQMMALPFVPAITSHPRIFPLMHSVFSPESCQYFPVRQLHSDLRTPRIAIGTSGPSLCLSDQLKSDPTVSRSTVTIQEILDENTEQSRNGSPASTSGQPDLSSGDSELKIPKLVQGNVSQMKKYGIEPKSVDVDWAKQRSWDSRSATPLSSSQVSHTLQSSHMYPRPQQLPRVGHVRCIGVSPPSAEPLMIRTMGHDPMTDHIPRTQNSQMYSPLRVRSGINMEGARPSFLAPPVRIRSVVPVCSAPPPPRRVPIPRQDSTYQRTEKKGTESDDTSA